MVRVDLESPWDDWDEWLVFSSTTYQVSMMNLRTSLVSAATVTMFGLGLAGSPADAASTSCWYGNQGERLEHFECDVNRRINYNGHVVWDIRSRQGGKLFTFVLWGNKSDKSGKADYVYNGTSHGLRWYEDRDGDIRLVNHSGSQLAVRFPGHSSPQRGGGVIPAGTAYGDMFQR